MDVLAPKRKLVAIICLGAILLAALAPATATSGSHAAFLVPLGPLFGLVVIGPSILPAETDSYRFPVLEITGSRPPPAL
jgi:hypothetical protein